ncbi:MAG: hypothetical protein IPK87_11910 [Planctomycetes bacterium]|nr:hypothetical protein [Planctomycetota bacterium]
MHHPNATRYRIASSRLPRLPGGLRVAPLLVLLGCLCVAALAPLRALDGDAETKRWARRALLDEATRKHMNLDVGEVEPLTLALAAPGDFGDADDQAVVVRRDAATAVVIMRGTTPLGRCTFSTTGALTIATRKLAGQTWVLLDESSELAGVSSTLRRLISLRDSQLSVRQSWVHSATVKIGKRFVREQSSDLRELGGSLLLTTLVVDRLDGKAMADCESETILKLTPQPDGSLRAEVDKDKPVPVAVRLRHARTLEREGLEEAAMLLAREAREQSTKLPAEDARRLDAAGLVARLEARLLPADKPVQVSPR